MAPNLTPTAKALTGTTFSCLACLIAFNIVINALFPSGLPKFQDTANLWGTQVAKLPPLMQSRENADVLIVGASGILFPSVRCDDAFYQRQTRYDDWYMKYKIWSYSKSDYFANLLSKRLGKDISIANSAVGGCMMSDQYLILNKYLASGKKPKMILLFSGPKDFLDNHRTKIEKTSTYVQLADFPIRVGDILQGNTRYDTAIPELTEAIMQSVSSFYFYRDDYRAMLAHETSKLTHHPEDLKKAMVMLGTEDKTPLTKQQKEEAKERADAKFAPSKDAKDLALFRKIYLPINTAQFETQTKYFEKIIALAKEHNIPLQVTFMPLTPQHTAVLPPETWATYKRTVRSIAEKAHIACWDPVQDVNFQPQDFEDSAHLDAAGGQKFFKYLTDRICDDPRVCQTLTDQKVLIGQH
ncbi:MAG: DUF1574 domain-containing protein [Candidatus Melainabacteria bacterium]|nr:MAG: DUF1574 domain-containing protein [Candidatus Melainabacteria bacterium]